MKRHLLILLMLMSASGSWACRCALPLPGFGFHAKHAPIVALVKVSSYDKFSDNKKPVAMSAKVLYVHKGNIPSSMIMIYGNSLNGNDCTTSIPESISLNKYLLVALYPHERDYQFGSCGKHYLNLTYWMYGLLLILISSIT